MRRFIFLIALLTTFMAQAGDFKWSGVYRFEGLQIDNPELSDGSQNKAYMLHHLTLKPEIVAYDGLTIRSRFELFNNSRHPNSQLGQTLGSGVGSSNPVDANSSNATSEQLASETLLVSQLYATWVHEFGVLTVGRAPIHFGLGMRFNAGNGVFDHWFDTRDIVAYKFVMGNFYLMPVLAKLNEGLLSQEDDVNDYIFQAMYENPETELALGFIWQARRTTSNANSNDAPNSTIDGGSIVDPIFGGPGSTQTSNYEVDFYNFFVSQWVDSVKVAFEIGFADGNTGISSATGQEVDHNGFGVVVEFDYMPKSSAWDFELDLGYASGDDPTTTGTYEGYIFDRNYDVAFLLFNHPLGQRDFFRTAYTRNSSTNNAVPGSGAASDYFDEETISNTLYASFGFNYKWAEKYAFQPRITYAQLNKDPLGANVDSAAGYELDLTFKYTPFEGFQWINRVGAFFPGSGFEGGTNNLPAELTYGIETKAAISF